jgi:hypothetical protein
MNFIVGKVPRAAAQSTAYLEADGWDDWFSFQTLFILVVFDEIGARHDIGAVKIGEQGLRDAKASDKAPGKRAPSLPTQFKRFTERHFSLGQNENYYEGLNELPDGLRTEILASLRDCAFDLTIFNQHEQERVMQISLLRSVPESHVKQRFNRLAHGNAALTDFFFEYSFAHPEGVTERPQISFQVQPLSEPPTNLHVLIGRNGVGKTRCFRHLVHAILNPDTTPEEHGQVSEVRSEHVGGAFAGLVVVSFSAFDEFALPKPIRNGILAHRIGIPVAENADTGVEGETQPLRTFEEDFREAIDRCISGPRLRRFREAITTLETDPLFAEANISALLNGESEEAADTVTALFERMSSGHKIVLLSITRLVELVDERTLVLLDEPEGHLHPPLLSAFVRALSDLLVKRNGVAIVSTHSPVVLQEVPKSCAWLLWRSGREARVARPEIETFGENVGILTREVFGLEVTRAGFHRLLKVAVAEPESDFDSVMAKFSGQLGAEAQMIVRSLLAIRDRESLQ